MHPTSKLLLPGTVSDYSPGAFYNFSRKYTNYKFDTEIVDRTQTIIKDSVRKQKLGSRMQMFYYKNYNTDSNQFPTEMIDYTFISLLEANKSSSCIAAQLVCCFVQKLELWKKIKNKKKGKPSEIISCCFIAFNALL